MLLDGHRGAGGALPMTTVSRSFGGISGGGEGRDSATRPWGKKGARIRHFPSSIANKPRCFSIHLSVSVSGRGLAEPLSDGSKPTRRFWLTKTPFTRVMPVFGGSEVDL